jgi:hypothetical protein
VLEARARFQDYFKHLVARTLALVWSSCQLSEVHHQLRQSHWQIQ